MKLKACLISINACAGLFFILFTATRAQTSLPPEQINSAIQEKSRELQTIQTQLQETQKNLSETTQKSQSLNQELGKIKKNIKQLDIGIKSNQITIDTLSLEISGLQYTINETEQKISATGATVKNIMQEIQEFDDENALFIFLKNKTLAGGISEQTHLQEISGNLAKAIADLKKLNDERAMQLQTAEDKKIGVKNEYQTLKVRKSLIEEQKNERQNLLTATKNKEKNYQQILADLAKKQAEIASEIEAMDAQLRLKINPNKLPTPRSGVLGWPVLENQRITQGYGGTAFALRGGYRGKWHNGIDMGGALGMPIIAAEEGIILNTGNQDLFCKRGAYGKYIIIKHPNNLTTLYGHLSHIAVETGTKVARGQVVGYMGKTGYALGTHLHFTVFDSATFTMRGSRSCGIMPSGGDLDPQKYL